MARYFRPQFRSLGCALHDPRTLTRGGEDGVGRRKGGAWEAGMEAGEGRTVPRKLEECDGMSPMHTGFTYMNIIGPDSTVRAVSGFTSILWWRKNSVDLFNRFELKIPKYRSCTVQASLEKVKVNHA